METQLLYGKSPVPVTAQVTADTRPLKIYQIKRVGKHVDVRLHSQTLPEYPHTRHLATFDGRARFLKAWLWIRLERARVL